MQRGHRPVQPAAQPAPHVHHGAPRQDLALAVSCRSLMQSTCSPEHARKLLSKLADLPVPMRQCLSWHTDAAGVRPLAREHAEASRAGSYGKWEGKRKDSDRLLPDPIHLVTMRCPAQDIVVQRVRVQAVQCRLGRGRDGDEDASAPDAGGAKSFLSTTGRPGSANHRALARAGPSASTSACAIPTMQILMAMR